MLYMKLSTTELLRYNFDQETTTEHSRSMKKDFAHVTTLLLVYYEYVLSFYTSAIIQNVHKI